MEKKAGWRNHGGMAWHNITKQREREKATQYKKFRTKWYKTIYYFVRYMLALLVGWLS